MMMEVSKREQKVGIVADPDLDTYMKVLGLNICADTIVGDDMRRGISGGQKRRLTTGKVLYQGPRDQVVELFKDCGFRYPQRKGVADFLLVVISRKDQTQYWYHTEDPYHYVLVDMFCQNSRNLLSARSLMRNSQCRLINPKATRMLFPSIYSLSKWQLLRACMSREYLFLKRNTFIYVFKTTQIVIIPAITMTVFLRTQMDIDVLHATYCMGALFSGLMILLIDGIPELSLTTARLPALLTMPLGTAMTSRASLLGWLKWGLWVSPLSYGEIGLSVNEFLAPRWQKLNTNTAPGSSCAIISQEKLAKIQGSQDSNDGGMVLPFEPLSEKKKLHLLSDVTGALRPGVLTALMGVSGAGKSTLLDILAGRKTTGYVKGEI
ncbi:hypothetical protein Pint_21490 [Pistacia integerrima]|uniref:Uncharacterized protein n=1 Tax=Pistacia integerrima TaxID=434235 RepID=A0ACC0XA01_9ROSI|nr:hypothetical protein Pint_21490 [Pistacia integerrima]